MSKWKQCVSSPMRCERMQGMFFVTCHNVADKATGDHIMSLHQGESRTSFADAKRNFWNAWKEDMPMAFLTPRNDNPHANDRR